MDIMNMSVEEIGLIGPFTDLAQEALAAEALIKAKFTNAFGIGKQEVCVYHTESFGEYYGDGYLSIDGVFRYHDNWWGGREYQFRVDADGIYKMLRSCYLKKINKAHLEKEPFECKIENIDHYFRDFIQKLAEKG